MAQKSQNDPNINSKSNVRIEGNIEDESCLTTQIDSRTVFKPYSNPKNSPLGPNNVKNDCKIRSKSNVRIEGNIENISCSTTQMDPRTVFKPYPNPNPKNSPLGPHNVKNDRKIRSKSNVRIEGNIENESCSTKQVDPNTVWEPYPIPKNCPLGLQKVKDEPKIKSKSNVRIEENK